jgi:hypothetical protein
MRGVRRTKNLRQKVFLEHLILLCKEHVFIRKKVDKCLIAKISIRLEKLLLIILLVKK